MAFHPAPAGGGSGRAHLRGMIALTCLLAGFQVLRLEGVYAHLPWSHGSESEDMQVKVAAWFDGDCVLHSVGTVQQAEETAEAFCLRHDQAVRSGKEAFPPHPTPSACGGAGILAESSGRIWSALTSLAGDHHAGR